MGVGNQGNGNIDCSSNARTCAATDGEVSSIDSYGAATDYLYSRINYERIGMPPYTPGNYRLDRMRALLSLLGNPQDRFDIVHIAGTKGKGTTATLVAHCLHASGIKTGLYTSPHLEKIEERIWLSGEHISAQQFVELTGELADAAKQLAGGEHGMPTFFEQTTAMGLLHFARSGADVVVLEVGLGGRLDSTNVCNPRLTAITPIGLDHQAQLGNTIEKIAKEKAGIIKKGVPLVCSAQNPEAQSAILDVAKEAGVECLLIDRDFSFAWRPSHAESAGTTAAEILFQPSAVQLGPFEGVWKTRLLGQHQGINISAALAILGCLHDMGFPIDRANTMQAIATAQPPCRLELISTSPTIIVDTAHTPESVEAALSALKIHYPDRNPIAVFATSKDKDFSRMLCALGQSCSKVVLTKYQGNPRGVPTEALSRAFDEIVAQENRQAEESTADCCQISLAATPHEALKIARSACGPEELILVIGSFFLAGELRPIIQDFALQNDATGAFKHE